MTGIPQKISDYLKAHFREDFLCGVRKVKDAQGHTFYIAEVDQDNSVHRLKFSEQGNLVDEQLKPAFPSGDPGDQFADEGFDLKDLKDIY